MGLLPVVLFILALGALIAAGIYYGNERFKLLNAPQPGGGQ